MHPHIIKLPPPNLTVPSITLSPKPSPMSFHTYFLPSDPNLLILVSSDNITLFQSSKVHSACLSANSSLAFLCWGRRRGCFHLTTGHIPACFSFWCIVWAKKGWLVTSWIDLVTWVALSTFPILIILLAWLILAAERMEGRPPEDLGRLGRCIECSLLIDPTLTPVSLWIWWPETPAARRERIWEVWEEDSLCMASYG